MLDVWIAEAQLLGGGLYISAFRQARKGDSWQALAIFGALIIIGFTVPILPVLFSRAPVRFRIPAIVYLLSSVYLLAASIGSRRTRSKPAAAQVQPLGSEPKSATLRR